MYDILSEQSIAAKPLIKLENNSFIQSIENRFHLRFLKIL